MGSWHWIIAVAAFAAFSIILGKNPVEIINDIYKGLTGHYVDKKEKEPEAKKTTFLFKSTPLGQS
jgi:hypothetical protein